MDAWSLAMKDENNSQIDGTKSESDDNLVQQLMERVERVESKTKRSEEEIRQLKRRLSTAEQRISPLDNSHIPWRRIGNDEESNKVEEGEFQDSDIKPEEEYQLPKDVYSIVASWKFNSRPFWISILVSLMQITLLSLLLTDQFQVGGRNDLVNFPTNVPVIVHWAQALATIIAIMGQDDLRSAIEQYFDGPPTRFKGHEGFGRMTKAQWNFSCAIRFSQGFLSVLSAFILAIQAETVFDVLLNFLGVQFVSELDDLAFGLSALGYLGQNAQRAAKCISEAKFQQDNRNKVDQSSWNLSWFYTYAHVIGVFGVLVLLLGVFVAVVIGQNTGRLSAPMVKLEVAQSAVPFAAIFSGCYEADRKGQRYDRRLRYKQIGFPETGGKFGFCASLDGEQAWTFSLGTADPCTQWFGRSEATTTFNILEVGDNANWFSSDDTLLGNLQISRVLNPAEECGGSTIDKPEDLCKQLNAEGLLDVTQDATRPTFFYKTFVNSTLENAFTYQASTHPIYVGKSSTPQKFYLIFFTGQCWVLTDALESKMTRTDVSMEEYMQNDPEFISILYTTIYIGTNVALVTGSVVETENLHTPLGLSWYYMRQQDPRVSYNYPTADESRPVDLEVSCAACNNSTNRCAYDGICRDNQICDCVNGGSGPLCRKTPLGDSICNPYFNDEQFDWDGGDCCGGSCNGPECGLGGLSFPFEIDSEAQGIDEFNILGYEFCEDPKMAPVTIELKDFEDLDNEEWNAIVGNQGGDPFCSTAAVNVRCDGITYLHVPQHILATESACNEVYTETIHVPFGSRCELSTNIACFGIFCLDHNVSVYYGNDTNSEPIRTGRVRSDEQLTFGIPLKCLTEVLSEGNFSIFDLSTDQGLAANALSNDGLSEFLCDDNRVENRGFVLERFALSVFNQSVHFNSTNWEPYQCHGYGIPAFHSKCSFFSITSLILEVNSTTQVGTIPTELSLLTRLNNLVLRGNRFTGTIPTELGLLTELGGLELWSNNLSGTIPSELGLLTKVSAIALADNRLQGTIPMEILGLSLTGIWLDGNRLGGGIPKEFGNMPLVSLSLNFNQFSGTVPSTLFDIPSLSSLGLGYNLLTGTLPQIGNSNLNTLFAQNNSLTGSLPPNIGQLPWFALDLGYNSLTGTIPFLPVMDICNLENNNFTGGLAPSNCTI